MDTISEDDNGLELPLRDLQNLILQVCETALSDLSQPPDQEMIENRAYHAESDDVIVSINNNSDHKKNRPVGFGKNTFFQTPALSVKNACKSYSKKAAPVLKDFCMTVEQGTIYSLLGSSGCGKTTILSCCVGLRSLDSGEIMIYGSKPGTRASGVPGRRVGYMPQEIALYTEFSIREILQYFGRIYGMTAKEVKENTEFLISFLALPPAHRIINSLSGGQQRRVSFAVALVHNPELLILDEPTVGVDPLLRQSIWSHLSKLVTSGRTTVIITTHYIEEARDSDRIGLMRNGRLLEENSPGALLELHNTHLLEDIVLKLCLKDTAESSPTTKSKHCTLETIEEAAISEANDYLEHQQKSMEVVVPRYTRRQSCVDNMKNQKQIFQKRHSLADVLHRPSNAVDTNIRKTDKCKEFCERMFALSMKNVLVLLRNVTFLLFILVLPATQVVLICLAIGSDPKGIKFALINYDTPNLDECDVGTGCIFNEAYNGSLSCLFLDSFYKDSLALVPYESEELAIEDVKQTKLWGIIIFPENFTENMKDRALFGPTAELETIIGSQVTFSLDMSNKQVGLQMKKIIVEAFATFIKGIGNRCDIDPAKVDIPVHFTDPPIYGTNSTSFTEFIAPGVLMGILFFFPLCASVVSIISEKKSGALDRSLVAGVTKMEVMLAYSVTQFNMLVFQTCIAFAIMILAFEIDVQGSLFLAILISILVGVAGINVGFLLSTFCNEELEAIMIAMGSFFPVFILSGLFWPIEGMPGYMQYVRFILPCTLAGESLRSLISRGADFWHPAVWPGFISTSLWILMYWAITVTVLKFAKKK